MVETPKSGKFLTEVVDYSRTDVILEGKESKKKKKKKKETEEN